MTTIETFEQEPLLAQDKSPLIKTQEQRASLWTSRQKKVRRVVIPPHHLMGWIHDNRPTVPIPKDAQFKALGMDAAENWIGFEYASLVCPESKAFYMKITDLLLVLRDMLRDKMPADCSVTGIYLSDVWAFMMIEIASHRFPDVTIDTLPLIQVRYEGGELTVSDQSGHTKEKV